jgi:hypothetical protein
VGSPYDRENAEWILAKFKEWGLDASIETFDVLFPTPKQRLVELVAPTHFKARLDEPTLSVDPTSSQKAEQLPTYNAYSRDGDVTAPLVYVNYGLPDDYERLERLGVSVKGAIVIARYGNSWRGIKPKVAAEHGALGCIIYSDPRDDGYFGGAVFPEGPMRPRDGVQRGSVLDMPLYPGDPLTPGIPATPDAKRLDIKDAPTMTKIPVLPISYGDAQPLLASLTLGQCGIVVGLLCRLPATNDEQQTTLIEALRQRVIDNWRKTTTGRRALLDSDWPFTQRRNVRGVTMLISAGWPVPEIGQPERVACVLEESLGFALVADLAGFGFRSLGTPRT